MTRDLITGSRAQQGSTRQVEHRPWPLPEGAWVMGQTWRRLLFAHWALPVERLARMVPEQLPLDTWDGQAWLGITPFEVSAVRLRWSLPIPWVSAFPECNVRTYVTVGGKPGIYFFSLDTGRRLAVEAARRTYRLPYFHARMRVRAQGGWTSYESDRLQGDGPPARLDMRYRGGGEVFEAAPGTLDHFLTERYCLYTLDSRGRVLRGDIHHRPWPLRCAEAEVLVNTMAQGLGLSLDDAPLLHLAERQDVVFWPLAELEPEVGAAAAQA